MKQRKENEGNGDRAQRLAICFTAYVRELISLRYAEEECSIIRLLAYAIIVSV